MIQILLIFIAISLVVGFASILLPIFFVIFIIYLIYRIYLEIYLKSKKFRVIKKSIENNTKECNEFNRHINNLKNTYVNYKTKDYGTASYIDESRFNFKRLGLKNQSNSSNVYNCSLTVCKNAQQQPFKYICKYFGVATDEKTLEQFENILNDFSAAEEGKILLKNERDKIFSSISHKIPAIIRKFSLKRVMKELGFEPVSFDQCYFPTFEFRYVSAGGNSSMKSVVTFDIDNLNKFVEYLSDCIKFRNSAKGQRALMTTALRTKIKQRDNYTCQHCGLSTEKEPNLLLEIDHIIPIAENGLTTEDNLQTLCWKCNRTKGKKIYVDDKTCI